MKLINGKLAAAAVLLGSASSLLAGGTVKTYEFEFKTAATGFMPTYIWVRAALDTPTDLSLACTKFSIQTPKGTWTAGQFAPTAAQVIPGTTTGTPFWAFGQVEITGGGNTLLFTKDAQLESFISAVLPTIAAGPTWNVDLSTTQLSDSFLSGVVTAQDAPPGTGTADGSWVNVNPVTTAPAPDATGTLVLMLGAFGILGACKLVQSRSVATQA